MKIREIKESPMIVDWDIDMQNQLLADFRDRYLGQNSNDVKLLMSRGIEKLYYDPRLFRAYIISDNDILYAHTFMPITPETLQSLSVVNRSKHFSVTEIISKFMLDITDAVISDKSNTNDGIRMWVNIVKQSDEYDNIVELIEFPTNSVITVVDKNNLPNKYNEIWGKEINFMNRRLRVRKNK